MASAITLKLLIPSSPPIFRILSEIGRALITNALQWRNEIVVGHDSYWYRSGISAHLHLLWSRAKSTMNAKQELQWILEKSSRLLGYSSSLCLVDDDGKSLENLSTFFSGGSLPTRDACWWSAKRAAETAWSTAGCKSILITKKFWQGDINYCRSTMLFKLCAILFYIWCPHVHTSSGAFRLSLMHDAENRMNLWFPLRLNVIEKKISKLLWGSMLDWRILHWHFRHLCNHIQPAHKDCLAFSSWNKAEIVWHNVRLRNKSSAYASPKAPE